MSPTSILPEIKKAAVSFSPSNKSVSQIPRNYESIWMEMMKVQKALGYDQEKKMKAEDIHKLHAKIKLRRLQHIKGSED